MDKASRILGTIKHTIRTAPEKSKLLAYTSLCRPIMEYADTLRDPQATGGCKHRIIYNFMVASDYSKLLGVATPSKYSYKNPIPRYLTLTDVPSKIIPQCFLCLQVTTHKIWSRYLHIKRRSEPFPHSDQRCLFCSIGHVDQNCINFWFSEFAYIFSKYCF